MLFKEGFFASGLFASQVFNVSNATIQAVDQKTLISSHLFVLRNKDVIYNYIECTEVHDNFTERANVEFTVTIPNGKNTILVKRQNNSVRVKRQSTTYKVKRSSNTIRVK